MHQDTANPSTLNSPHHSAITNIGVLNRDVLLVIFGFMERRDRKQASRVCRTYREALLAQLFANVIWRPALRRFAPESILPYIRQLTITAAGFTSFTDSTADDIRSETATLLRGALPHMRSLRMLTIANNMDGGLWPELVDALNAATSTFTLMLDASWLTGKHFNIPKQSSPLLIDNFDYPFAYFEDTFGPERAICAARRPPLILGREQDNINAVLSACRTTVKQIYVPSELLLRAMDSLAPWGELQELYVEGYWPEEHFHHQSASVLLEATEEDIPSDSTSGDLSLTLNSETEVRSGTGEHSQTTKFLRLLELMPKLRSIGLMLARHPTDPRPLMPIVLNDPSSHPSSPQTFFSSLKSFQMSSIAAEERLLDFLPSSLEKLAVSMYPFERVPNYHRVEMKPGALLAILRRAHLPQLRVLQISYIIRSAVDLVSDEALLTELPSMFPLVEELEIRRCWVHREPGLAGLWDPFPRIRACVSGIKQLCVFRLHPEMPDRFGNPPFSQKSKKYWVHLNKLYDEAKGIVEAAPWLKELSMYLELGTDPAFHWKTWRVCIEDDTTQLYPRPKAP
ncbi:hypothetical protein MIND_00159400 [Mycena indigotica]|uniref:F-box domain-containing protein n=1 Tax=Mycena indigotica TaxID=2126181 RepID=A0A8H6TGS2_9AGAR|nr:uncharacterized protein MIND_00159400 [Mycena indigotica]KAF7316406.1 hypothetical protein MIND_00159400 [Mycena indigotica]